MLSPKNKRNLLRILPFGVVTFVFNIVYLSVENGILGDSTSYPSTGNPYVPNFFISSLVTTTIGFIAGAFEVFYLNKLFREDSFTKKITLKTLIYFFIISLTICITIFLTNSYDLGVYPWDEQVRVNAGVFLSNFAFWSIVMYFTLVVIICLFYTEVSDNIGQAVLWNFFTGKYHHPIEEERIFMFLDMKGSTTIAEKLGHVEYFKLLNKYYLDLSDPIMIYGGEIYKYVGDEVIVTWKYTQGDFKDTCVRCFFAMQEALNNQAKQYQKKYGLVPTFKAGIHLGKATTGEIGVLRKEIAFSGDVLNTTARIQGLCNTYEVDLLISEELVDALKLREKYALRELGKADLRGRNEKINLFTIE